MGSIFSYQLLRCFIWQDLFNRFSSFCFQFIDITSLHLNNDQGLFQQFIACNYRTQSPALFQNIFQIYTFLAKFSNLLPFLTIFCLFLPFFRKITCLPLLSRIGPDDAELWPWTLLKTEKLYKIISSHLPHIFGVQVLFHNGNI